MNHIDKLKCFFAEQFFVEFNNEITEETDLFKAGIIESKGYMNIIKYLQDELHIEMTDEDLFSNIFVSFSNIINFISKKQNQ